MSTDSFELLTIFQATPEEVYAAWLDSAAHAAFTGIPAVIDPTVGGPFKAWGDYISGVNQELEPGRRILQTWRTTEFAPEDPDSLLELILEPHPEGVQLTLRHSRVPEGQGVRYESGWQEHYFEGLSRWLRERSAKQTPAKERPARRAAPKKRAPTKAKKQARKSARKSAGPRAGRPVARTRPKKGKPAKRAKRRR